MNSGVFLLWFGLNCVISFLLPLFFFQELPPSFHDPDLPFFLEPSRSLRGGRSGCFVLFVTHRDGMQSYFNRTLVLP